MIREGSPQKKKTFPEQEGFVYAGKNLILFAAESGTNEFTVQSSNVGY